MGWNRQQNPTGISNPAVRPIQADPADLTTTKKDLRRVTRAKAGKTIERGGTGEPIAASSRKADGFAPAATGELG